MTELLEKRNAVVKDYAESEQWKAVLSIVPETGVTGLQ
jgi:hypothetical protein